MKKIFVIAQVKNEADIIESFCRYNLTYSDGMLIRDNGSSDNTKNIIQNLINEGLPIYWADNIFAKYPGMRNKDAYARKAIEEYGADLIIPLDADEFLYHIDGINPRETLEALREDVEYQALWRTYVYEKEPNIKLGFMPNNFTSYRNPVLEDPNKYERHKKVIVSGHLIKNNSATFVAGAHFLEYPEKYYGSVKIEILEKIVFVHFPIRSKTQVMRKVIPNWIYKWRILARAPRDILDVFQLGVLFNEIRDNGDIEPDKIKRYSLEYAMMLDSDKNGKIFLCNRDELEKIENDLGNTITIDGTMQTSFCTNKLKLRYTDYNENNKIFIRAVLTEIDKAVTYLSTESDEKSVLLKKYLPASTSFVFLDTGKGFNPKEVFPVPLYRHENYFEAAITLPPNVKNIRFDPVEGFACILENVQIVTDVGTIEYTAPLNGIAVGGLNLFDNCDPQVLIEFNGRNITNLKITGNMRHFIMDDISFLSKIKQIFNNLTAERDNLTAERDNLTAERDNLTAERDNLTAERDNLTAERDNLTAERDNLTAERNGLLNSRSWRFTRPLRKFIAFIKRHRTLYLFAKGILSIKRIGIIKTLKKVKNYKRINKRKHLINEYMNLSEQEKLAQKNKVFLKQIKISIITPLYNTKELFLNEMIDSVQAQTYSNWELCLADGSDREHEYVKRICRSYAKDDKRIKYCKLKNNEGIAENTIQAFNLSDGDYIILLDHDDLLAQNALFEVAKAINDNEDVDFIYSDRLIFDDKTKRILGHQYLPDFNPDLLRSFNYASHLNAFSRFIIDKVGFERTGYNGSQDYEFELRVTEAARKIVHIREILYYCRASEGSVAANPGSKLYAYENGRKAIEEHISRIGYSGKVEFIEKTFSYRIHYDISLDEKVSIIIPNRDNIDILSRCVDSILSNTTYQNYEINIIENNSVLPETFTYYENLANKYKYKDKIFVKNFGKSDEFNFSLLNNWAVKQTTGKYLLFLNNDTQVISPNWIEEMIMFAQRDDVGAVGVKLYYPDDTIQHSGLIINHGDHCASNYDNKASKESFGYMHCLNMVRNYSAVTAACMMIKRNDFIVVNGFNEELFKIGLNDVDICLMLREKNKLIVFTPYAELYHFEGASRGRDYEDANLRKRFLTESNSFREKWRKYFEEGDPYFYKNEY